MLSWELYSLDCYEWLHKSFRTSLKESHGGALSLANSIGLDQPVALLRCLGFETVAFLLLAELVFSIARSHAIR